MKQLIDQLSWEEFYKSSTKKKKIKKVEPFNRLIAHTKNYFLIGGYGAFTEGYVLIITKDFIPSYGLIEEINNEELNFLISIVKKMNIKKYKKSSVIFEHGMCACVGGLDRAHIHIMTINEKTTEDTLLSSINQTLYSRKAGIDSVEYKNFKLQNIHDINHFFENKQDYRKNEIKINGKILSLEDIKNLNQSQWPFVTLNHIQKGGHYVYFNSPYEKASFLTTNNFKTQFGREVVFHNEIKCNKKFKKKIEEFTKKNPHLEAWKWQNCMFDKNVISTVNGSKKFLKEDLVKNKKNYQKYNYEVI